MPSPAPCWNCGALPACQRCGSVERRRTRPNDCAECHRRGQRARYKPRPRPAPKPRPRPAARNEIVITPEIRAYLRAFDAWLLDRTRTNRKARKAALDRLEGPL